MEALAAFAPLFAYPGPDYAQQARACCVRAPSSAAAAFSEAISRLSAAECQELFVQTFDLNPACALEIGWHLFGEQYERGALLVHLREQLRAAGIAEGGELPDHLTHVLPLVDRLAPEDAESFVEETLHPALDKMVRAVPDGNPFGLLLRAVQEVARPASVAARG